MKALTVRRQIGVAFAVLGVLNIIQAVATVGIGLFPNLFINAANWSLGLAQGSQHMAWLLR